MSAWLRAGIGAGIGAFMGRNDGWSGMLGGAAAGAAMGGFGGAAMSKWSGGGGLSRLAGKGMGYANRAANRLRPMTGPPQGMMGRMAFRGGNAAKAGVRRTSTWLGNNAVGVNKYGGRALQGLAMGTAGYIGSSILSSNGGF